MSDFGHRSIFKKNEKWGYSYRKNLYARFLSSDSKFGSYLIQSNSEGFRNEYNSEDFIKSKCKKILLIGCSFAAGDGVSNNQRFLDIFCNESDYIMYNAAIPGTGHDQQFLILKDLIKKLKPDFVFFAPYSGCANRNLASTRAFKDSLHGSYTNRPKPFFTITNNSLKLNNVPVPAWEILPKLIKNNKKNSIYSRFSDLINKIPYFRIKEFNKIYSGKDKYGQKLTRLIFKEILSLTKENGAKLIVMPLPAEHDFNSNKYLVNNFYNELASENNFLYIDVKSTLDKLNKQQKTKLFISSDGHYSPFGHKKISEIIQNSNVWDPSK